jgi:hypothetical protein
MNTNNSQISNTASEPSTSEAHNEYSIRQLISTGIVTRSQPSMHPNMIPSQSVLITDQSKIEILMRQREARRSRRRRRVQRRREQRAEAQHLQLAHQIRRRQMANKHFQQQQYYQYRWYEERQRQEQQARDRYQYILGQSPTFNELCEEVIEERLLDMYDWETMHPQNPGEQEQLYELDGIAALEQTALVQEEVEQSQNIDDIKNNSTPPSFDSIVYQLEQMQQNGETDQSPGNGPHEQYHKEQKEL